MMSQAHLPFQYVEEKTESNLTSFAGLPLYLEMGISSGLCAAIAEMMNTKTQGWLDVQIIISLILLNIAGGDYVEDIEKLERDEGLSMLLLKLETQGMKRKERREYERRWRKEKKRAFPSTSVIYRYLEQFHNKDEENKRVKGVAFIPERNEALEKLMKINQTLIQFAQKSEVSETATLDQDATLAATYKKTALYCYEKYKAYQPFNTYWHEQELLLHSELRDGNVPAGFEQLRILKECLGFLPQEVKKVFLRSDSAAYQEALLKYCANGENERFGMIEFVVSIKVSQAFKKAVKEVLDSHWKPIYKTGPKGEKIKTNQEWAEVCFVPSWAVPSKEGVDYRYIAIRECMETQENLPGVESLQQELPFQTIDLSRQSYKLFGIVTNRSLEGEELIHWHRERCGDSEKVHRVEKSELAGGHFPSQKFGANCAWWQIMVLAFNLNSLMKKLVFPEKLRTKALKALRFHIIQTCGRVIQHARGLWIKLSGGVETVMMITEIRKKILAIPVFFSTA